MIKLIKEAFSGKPQDLTSGSIRRAVILLAIPMVLEMLWESLFAVVDVFFVAQIGVNAVATVGLTETVITLVYSISIGLSMAATAMVARRIGEKNPEAAAKVAGQALVLGVFVSVVLGALGFWYAADILRLMGGSEELIEEGVGYTQIIFATNVVIMLLFLLNAIFRGAGDAWLAMASLMIANILNIILDPLLIFGIGPFPELGVKGAAVATSIGRGCGVLFQLIILFRGIGLVKVGIRHLAIDLGIIKRMVNISIGGISQWLIGSASWIFMMRIVAIFGEAVVAGYTISIRVIIFTILPAWGVSNAAATLVGQNLGAQKPERAEKSVWVTAFYNVVFLAFVGVGLFLFAPIIIGFFTDETEVIHAAVTSLRIFSLGYLFFAYGMVISAAFNGAGDTRTPTMINFICFWLLEIPLAYLLAVNMGWGPSGVYWSVAISQGVLAILAIYLFRKGKWKHTTV